MTTPLCFIDTETDGVHPDRRAWEVALIRRDDNGTKEESFFVEIDLSNANPFGLNVGRFYDRHPLGRRLSGRDTSGPPHWQQIPNSPTYGEDRILSEVGAAQTIAEMTHGAHLVGLVPNFDAEVFAGILYRNGLIPAWHHHLIDVEPMAVGYLVGAARAGGEKDVTCGGIAAPPWRSDELSGLFGIDPPSEAERHTALGDTRWAMRWYDRIMDGTEV